MSSGEPVQVRDRAGACVGYLAERDGRCEAVLSSGRSLGLYNSVGAALEALCGARTKQADRTVYSDV